MRDTGPRAGSYWQKLIARLEPGHRGPPGSASLLARSPGTTIRLFGSLVSSGYRAYFRPANVYVPIPPIVEGLAFLSRSPCDRLNWRPVPAFPSAGPPRVILHGTWGQLEVFNVHFPLREKARNIAADVLIDFSRAVGGTRSIALGDFNARLGEEPMNRLFRGGFADLWPALSPAVFWPENDRIDYVLGCSATTWTGSIRAVWRYRRRTGHPRVRSSRHSSRLGIHLTAKIDGADCQSGPRLWAREPRLAPIAPDCRNRTPTARQSQYSSPRGG